MGLKFLYVTTTKIKKRIMDIFEGTQNDFEQWKKKIRIHSNPVNMDTERAIKSVRINGLSVHSGSCYFSK